MKLFEFLREYLQKGKPIIDGSGNVTGYTGGLGFSDGLANIVIGAIFAIFMIVVTIIALFVFKQIIKKAMTRKLKKIKAEEDRLQKIREEGRKTLTDYNAVLLSEIRVDSPYKYVDVSKRAETISKATYNIVASIVWVIVIIIILDGFGINIVPFVTGAGIVGIAVAFGAQEFVKDFISGLFNIFENTYSVGELVEINGFLGTVREIGLRTTKIENWKGEYFIVNNGKINSVINRSRDTATAVIDIVLSNKVQVEDVRVALVTFCDEFVITNPNQYAKPTYSGLIDTSLISYTFRITAITAPASHIGVEREIRGKLIEYLETRGFEGPQTIVVTQ
ncbi:MAG: mechanosensitive ion channel family protein [Acholeplasmataceae bacterium]|jgi:small-conductance mechanosensitive channel